MVAGEGCIRESRPGRRASCGSERLVGDEGACNVDEVRQVLRDCARQEVPVQVAAMWHNATIK